MMGEALLGGTPHADNVGPALLGGVVLVRGYRPSTSCGARARQLFYAVAHPGIVVSTREAREALPKRIPLSEPLRSGATSADWSPGSRCATWR